jgi:hypothetical protein
MADEKPKATHGGKRPGAGRKPITVIPLKRQPQTDQISLDALEAMCQIGATQDDIAAVFHISKRVLQKMRKRDSEMREIMDHAYRRGQLSIRRMLWQKAMKGDIAALIFLGKAVCGLSDRVEMRHEVSGPGGKPIETKSVIEHTAVLDEFLDLIEVHKIHPIINATSETTGEDGPSGSSGA